jgi:DNA-binding MarR family transcriptional regulator
MTGDAQPEPEEVLRAALAVRRGVASLTRRLRSERPAHGVSSSKLSVLGRLGRGGPLTATNLAAAERIQPQSLTRLLADLEQRGLITRRLDEIDRRQLRIEITPAGTKLLDQDVRQQTAWLAQAIPAVLSPVEREVLRLAAQLMQRLADADVTVSNGSERERAT